MAEWFEDEVFWDTIAPFLFGVVRDDARTEVEVEGLTQVLGVAPGSRILDLPCGTGRHSVAWAARGHRVTGADRSEAYLSLAKQRAATRGVEVELVRSDMRELVRAGSFDVALNLFTSLGYFADPVDDLRVLRNLHASLVPGGKAVVEMAGKELMARNLMPRSWDELPGTDQFLLQEHALLPGLAAVENRWIWIGGAERREFRFTLRAYSGTELVRALTDAGFASVELYGDCAGAPYDLTAKRLIAVATK